ncbi:MAG TPA: FHA domain-containing protein [Kofleriaceae bacterium]|nr:FHA domain-containing protein [Kofleriaceae bacterium]
MPSIEVPLPWPPPPPDEPVACAAPQTPVETEPLDEVHRGAWFEGPDVVTALRVYDGEREYVLPHKLVFTLGASRQRDVAVPGADLSALHCAFVRTGARLRVHDAHSTNGLYLGDRRVDVLELHPGDTFTAAPLTFLAMNEEMRAQRPIIADIVGTSFVPTPDQVLVDAVKQSHPLLITGETGCDLDRLGRAIHAVSLRRRRALVELTALPDDRGAQRELLRRAARSSLLIRLDAIKAPLDPAFCGAAFSRDHHIRVIVVAPTAAVARRLLALDALKQAVQLEQLQHIWIRPLGMRPGDVPGLLDRLLAERRAAFRLADLTPKNRQVLCNHDWRDNFIGLRLVADRLAAIGRVRGWETMSWHERSAAVGIPKATLFEWFRGFGLTSPLLTRS